MFSKGIEYHLIKLTPWIKKVFPTCPAGLHLKLKKAQKSDINNNNSLIINSPIKTIIVSTIHSFLLQIVCKFSEWIQFMVKKKTNNIETIQHITFENFTNINKLKTKFICEKHKIDTRLWSDVIQFMISKLSRLFTLHVNWNESWFV